MEKEEIEFILTTIGAIFSIGMFGFLVKLFTLIQKISKEQTQILNEKYSLAKEETSLFKVKNENLAEEKTKLEVKLKELRSLLDDQKITVKQISSNDILKIESSINNKLKVLSDKLELLPTNDLSKEKDYSYHLSLGEANYSTKSWNKAAFHFNEATKLENEDWQVNFSKAISYANSREGLNSNKLAMKAYHETIANLPDDIESWIKGRCYIYLGAMQKRLRKLEEAELNIKFGLFTTSSKYEVSDGLYNLACVYAMNNNKKELLATLGKLKNLDPKFLKGVSYQLDNYFINFRSDPDFLNYLT